MRADLQEEYDRVLRRAIFKHGTIVDQHPSYGWQDGPATEHLRSCKPYSPRDVSEDTWYEFVSMGGPDEGRRHGMTLSQVSCVCGQLENRELRWEDNVHEVAEAVFEEALGGR